MNCVFKKVSVLAEFFVFVLLGCFVLFFLIKMLSCLNLEGSFLASNAHPLAISLLFK